MVTKAISLLIRGYQYFFSPLLGSSCRFHPSCSEYSHQAITRYGAICGMRLAISRIVRCHPWHPGGHDPVP